MKPLRLAKKPMPKEEMAWKMNWISPQIFYKQFQVRPPRDSFHLRNLELRLGELSRADNFHLGDAMSAIELMDPKMDCGMIPAKKTLGLEKSIEVRVTHLISTRYVRLG